MSKKKLIILLSGLIVLVLAVVGAIFVVPKVMGPTPTPTPTDQELPDSSQAYKDTQQYKDITGEKSEYFAYLANLNKEAFPKTSTAEAALATWTVDQYLKNAIKNPYFIANWWGTKDNYRTDSLKTYVGKYVSPEVLEQLTTQAATITGAGNVVPEYVSTRIFTPTTTVLTNCYDNWDMNSCLLGEPSLNTFNVSENPDGTIKVEVSLAINPSYQKPDASDGNSVVENRVYNLTFNLSKVNQPDVNDIETPVMVIGSIEGTVSISGLQDLDVFIPTDPTEEPDEQEEE